MLICFLGHAIIIIILSVFVTDEYFIPKKNSSHDQDVSGQLLKPQNAPTNSTSESTTTTMVEVISENNTCTPNKTAESYTSLVGRDPWKAEFRLINILWYFSMGFFSLGFGLIIYSTTNLSIQYSLASTTSKTRSTTEIQWKFICVASQVVRFASTTWYHRKMSRWKNVWLLDVPEIWTPQVTWCVKKHRDCYRHHWVRCTVSDHFFLMDCASVFHYWPNHA